MDEYKTSVVIDLGMCLRVPYASEDDGDGEGGVTDVSSGTLRVLIRPLIPCGKPNYISPEILHMEEPFDGFAIDLWASGVILFIVLVGLPTAQLGGEEEEETMVHSTTTTTTTTIALPSFLPAPRSYNWLFVNNNEK